MSGRRRERKRKREGEGGGESEREREREREREHGFISKTIHLMTSANRSGRTITTFSNICVCLSKITQPFQPTPKPSTLIKNQKFKGNPKKWTKRRDCPHVHDIPRRMQKRQRLLQCVATQIERRRNLRHCYKKAPLLSNPATQTSLSMHRKLKIPWSRAADTSDMIAGHVSFSSSSRETVTWNGQWCWGDWGLDEIGEWRREKESVLIELWKLKFAPSNSRSAADSVRLG